MLGTYARLLFTWRVDKNDNDIYEGDSVIAMETTFTVAYSTERTAFVLQREGFPDNLLCQFEEVEILIPNIQYNA